MLTLLYFFLIFILWWSFQGYLLYLHALGKRQSSSFIFSASTNGDKHFFIIVPSYNEEKMILKKIENLRELDYKNYEVCFADASSDTTPDLIAKAIAGIPNFRLLSCTEKGKIAQVNEGLKLAKSADYVMLNDVDTLIPKNTLQTIAQRFNDPSVGVVGGHVTPLTKYKLDIYFWQTHNAIKNTEALYGYAPIVSGACCAFRKSIIDHLPDDAYGDDVYIPLEAHLKGYSCVYCSFTAVEELRAPQRFETFLEDKVRKSSRIIKEFCRFLPKVPQMPHPWRIIYLTKFLQIVLSPLLLIALGIGLLNLNHHITTPSIWLAAILLTGQIFISRKNIKDITKLPGIALVFALTEITLFAGLLKYLAALIPRKKS